MALQTYQPPDPSNLPSYFDFGFLPPAGTYFTLFNRIYLVKAIANPLAPTIAVNIPVLLQKRTSDGSLQWWATDHPFDPTDADTTRIAHAARVFNTGNLDIGGDAANADPTQYVDAERVDAFTAYVRSDDPYQSGIAWEIEYQLDNVTGEGDETTPAHFHHEVTQIGRWYLSDGAGNVIDPTVFVDIEYVYSLLYQQGDDGGLGALINQEYERRLQVRWLNPDSTFSTASNPQPLIVAF